MDAMSKFGERGVRGGAVALLAAFAALIPAAARSEIPALGREFRTESYLRTADEFEAVAAQRRVTLALAGGAHLSGDAAGAWNPAGTWKRVGAARADLAFQFGRLGLGADATVDHRRNADAREFENRVWASAYVPEWRFSSFGAAGFGEGGYRGADVSLECLLHRWVLSRRSTDIRPRVWGWTRFRQLEESDDPVLTPGLGIAIQHAVVVASQAYFALSAECDLSQGARPAGLGLLQLGWATNAVPISGGGAADPFAPPEPGARPASPITRSFFVTFGYGFPLDPRAEGRLALHLGIRFLRPIGGL